MVMVKAVVMQRSRDEAMECPGLDHAVKHRKEWSKHDESINR